MNTLRLIGALLLIALVGAVTLAALAVVIVLVVVSWPFRLLQELGRTLLKGMLLELRPPAKVEATAQASVSDELISAVSGRARLNPHLLPAGRSRH